MIVKFLSLIKFSHTIFAMPFAIMGYAMGIKAYGFDWVVLMQIVVCMIFARSAAMGFNRIVDREYDARNPRTASREIPSGQISTTAAAWFVAVCCCGFVITALTINVLCFFLSPVALAVILGYSYTKRFTSWCHLVLGLALSIAPIGAYVAVTGSFAVPVFMVGLLVLTWVSGFDIIFALQDANFDKSTGLYSIPSKLGIERALWVSSTLHIITAMLVVCIGLVVDMQFSYLYWIGAAAFVGLLLFQHIIVKANDLSRVGLAFGTTNGLASIVYASFAIAAILLRS